VWTAEDPNLEPLNRDPPPAGPEPTLGMARHSESTTK
jgi:hypothetical protein